jgi:hypothetical protein
MRKSLIATAVVLAAGSFAAADIDFQVVQIDNSAGNAEIADFDTNHYTFDLQVIVSGDDDWTAINANALTAGGMTWYQHPFGNADGTPPNPAFFGSFAALEFDSYWSAAAVINPGESGIAPGFAGVPVQTDTQLEANWFDTVVTGDGTFTLARYTFMGDIPGDGILGTVEGSATARNTGGELHPFSLEFVIPSPSSAALFGLAGLAGLRRRR